MLITIGKRAEEESDPEGQSQTAYIDGSVIY